MELGEEAVTAEILGEDGTWAEKTEGTDFTVDRAAAWSPSRLPRESPR